MPFCSASFTAASPAFTVNFGESSTNPTAFKSRGPGSPVLGDWLLQNTETGYPETFPLGRTPPNNTAASATRVRMVFAGLTPNVTIFVPVSVFSNETSSGVPVGFDGGNYQ